MYSIVVFKHEGYIFHIHVNLSGSRVYAMG
jgi:hypothetical protein